MTPQCRWAWGVAAEKELGDWLATVQPENGQPTISKQDIEDAKAFIRMEKCHDIGKVKILIGMNGWNLRPAALRALRAAGGFQVCTGPPPPGWVEDELSIWLAALEF